MVLSSLVGGAVTAPVNVYGRGTPAPTRCAEVKTAP